MGAVRARRALHVGRVVWGTTLLSLGLVGVLPAADDVVWQLGVLVTESGHWAAVLCLPPRDGVAPGSV